MDVIAAYELSKRYGDRAALSGLTFQVQEGQALACVGGAGSGKTTLIRLLSGLCRPTSGECVILGMSPSFEAEKLHAVTGTVLDTAPLYRDMTLTENMKYFAGINGVNENDSMERMSSLFHRLNIWGSRDEKVIALPTGAAFRASLARALMHRPKVLLADIPAGGLDRETAESVKELIAYLTSQEGVTVLLCTSGMAGAQWLCGEFLLLDRGVSLARGDLASLAQGAGVRCRARLRLAEGEASLRGFTRAEDGFWEREVASEEEMPKIISYLTAAGKSLYEARLVKPTLEEIYQAFLEGGIRRAGVQNEQIELDGNGRRQAAADGSPAGESAGREDEA